MSTVIRSGYPDLFDLSIAAKDYFADAYGAYPMPFELYFDIHSSSLKSEKISQLSGLTVPTEVGENADFPEVTPVEGYDVTATPLQYAASLPISRLTQADDPKGIFTGVELASKMHAKAMRQKASILAATLLTGSMTVAGPDGQYLVDTDHPTAPDNATTLSNKITAKLDAGGLALQDIITKIATNGKDMAGNQILFGRWKLVVPPALHANALKSCVALYGTPFAVSNVGVLQGVVGGNSSPTPIQTGEIFRQNNITGSTIEVIQDPFIGSGYSGGSDVKWYLIADPAEAMGFHSLRWYWREAPNILPVWVKGENKAIHVDAAMRCAAVAIDWRHVWASDGTA